MTVCSLIKELWRFHLFQMAISTLITWEWQGWAKSSRATNLT